MSHTTSLSARWPGLSLLALVLSLPALQETAARRLITFTSITFVTLAMGRTVLGRADLRGTRRKKKKQPTADSPSSPSSEKQASPTAVHLEETTCLICQEPVGRCNPEGITESWSMLPCGHTFGSHCIKRYLSVAADEQPLCPICRAAAYHDPCGHPVLPFVLRPDGTHPDLVVADPASGRLRPPTALDDLATRSCQHCRALEERRRLRRRRRQQARGGGGGEGGDGHGDGHGDGNGDSGGHGVGDGDGDGEPAGAAARLKKPWRWLRGLVASHRSKGPDENIEGTASVENGEDGGRGESDERGGDSAGEDDEPRLTRQEARTRRRTQATTNGVWQGPWVDIPTRDVEWEKWWGEQAPRGV